MCFDLSSLQVKNRVFHIRIDVSDPEKKVFTYSVPSQSKILGMIHDPGNCILELMFNLPDKKESSLVLQRRAFFIEGEIEAEGAFPKQSIWGPFLFSGHGEKRVVT